MALIWSLDCAWRGGNRDADSAPAVGKLMVSGGRHCAQWIMSNKTAPARGINETWCGVPLIGFRLQIALVYGGGRGHDARGLMRGNARYYAWLLPRLFVPGRATGAGAPVRFYGGDQTVAGGDARGPGMMMWRFAVAGIVGGGGT